ncbi:sensor histidine kinase [Clostridium sp. DL1XJH146]
MFIALNYFSVLIFGILIMSFFLDIKMNKKNVLILSGYITLVALVQIALYYACGWEFIEKSYPFIVHLPLVVFFCIYFKRRLDSVLFVLFTAYAFTAPRKWIGDLVASFLNNDPYVSILTKIIVSVVLLVVIYMFLCPYVTKIVKYSGSRIMILTVIPAMSYFITYASTVYTDVLYSSNVFVIGLLGLGLNFCVYTFLIVYFNELAKSFESQIEQTVLKMQMEATIIEIEDYKECQKQTAIFRHDLHHHMNYLNTCILENNTDEAISYIAKINRDVEAAQIIQYCENVTINLILSAYVGQGKNKNINIEINTIVPKVIPMNSTDICVILANGIENAINACSNVENENDRNIRVDCRFKNKKLVLEICNTFSGEIEFEEDIPITREQNHGFGVKSIIAMVKEYQGFYSFSQESGIFTMRVILQ